MHWQKSVTSDQHQQNQNRPYLGVRVKEPVKELLKRKRGNSAATNSITPTVSTSYQTLPPYTSVVSNSTDHPYVDLDATTSLLPIQDEGTFYTGWISQPPSFQPITQWTACPEYISHETVSCPYTGDMYVQPMCQGYTVVGPPSVLTYTSQPLLTNFTTRSTTPCVATQLEYAEQQTPLTYFPWPQTIPNLPTATHSIPYQATPPTIQSQQFVTVPIPVQDSVPEELNESRVRRDLNNLPMEKLLQGEEGNDSYVLNHTLSIEGL
ncbi:POU domain class 2-associating factor 1-like [Bufo gargarizans]|uniref:POU domain class 2-associating factor 1-like n=1 Tax=Bufo gargarizans TaxID=30331 RepID=UPI001CF278C6|nr:POU domain class 2-associating factor 1-like [Bufo gargarizans]XP_044134424.1 POU domain class 2-associating factor 1-like [Bufo gargarizans]